MGAGGALIDAGSKGEVNAARRTSRTDRALSLWTEGNGDKGEKDKIRRRRRRAVRYFAFDKNLSAQRNVFPPDHCRHRARMRLRSSDGRLYDLFWLRGTHKAKRAGLYSALCR